ncbi:uncharacterized protein BDR25DRAFT_315148 [Lindgomyces ingoldianus]|uniref:Uncharacterized protein n=1 Tax=Lindgomyces ingoldianus TaxID=673940 RepID=A0ACB6QSM7_9PLEO|nr:uncharacterized protein BDR25DRAFT_315148 [Lindgomyces ingoldianus]KAF2469525.1 hypothetical protein BDR25DRAFT_315148 [Lindgomyces ingoldianus]
MTPPQLMQDVLLGTMPRRSMQAREAIVLEPWDVTGKMVVYSGAGYCKLALRFLSSSLRFSAYNGSDIVGILSQANLDRVRQCRTVPEGSGPIPEEIAAVNKIIYTIENVFVNVFQCVPVRKFWGPQTQGHCIFYGPFLAVNKSANSLIDFVLVIQAVIMLWSIQTDKKTKWRLLIVFTIGGLAGVIGFVKIGTGLAACVVVGNQYILGVWASV